MLHVLTQPKVLRSFFYSSVLFAVFIGFATLLHSLSCGYWCNMLLGSSR